MAEYSSMITVSCLATILFFGGWLSPFPQTGMWTWTHYIPAAVFAIAGVALIIHGIRYLTILGRVVLPMLGLMLCALAVLFIRPGVPYFVQGPFWLSWAGFTCARARNLLPPCRLSFMPARSWCCLYL